MGFLLRQLKCEYAISHQVKIYSENVDETNVASSLLPTNQGKNHL